MKLRRAVVEESERGKPLPWTAFGEKRKMCAQNLAMKFLFFKYIFLGFAKIKKKISVWQSEKNLFRILIFYFTFLFCFPNHL